VFAQTHNSISMNAKRGAVRRLLIITYHFPPDGAIGGQRWAGLSKYLARLGWEVHIVTASPPYSGEEHSNVHRHFCHPRRTFNDLYRSAIGRLRSAARAPNDRDASADLSQRPRFSWLRPFSALRQVIASSMYFPDYGRGWISRAANVARALLEEHEFDVVVTSGPPHSVHFVGLFAVRGRPEPLWIDMRDPWAASPAGHGPQDQLFRAERFLLSRLEKLLFQRASKVIANTLEFATALSAAEATLDVVYFPNGIDLEQLPTRDPSNVQRCSIACLGTLYAGRNLSSVLGAMRAVLAERPEDGAALRLRIAGPIESAHREQLLEEIATSALGEAVDIYGVIPRMRALDLLNQSHLALVLAQDQPMQVPAKLYECVGLGAATVVITEETSAAAREGRRIGAFVLVDGDIDGLRSILNEMLDGRLPTKIEATAPISYQELGVQMDRLLREALDSEPMR
jgi:glycosyltransferase involved in cell wall biosynthesis